MKKFAISVFSLAIILLGAFYFSGGNEGYDAQEATGLAVAAYSTPTGGSEKDATAFLVGSFTAGDGTKVSFDGCGGMEVTPADGEPSSGSYALTQNADRSATAEIFIDGEASTYKFSLLSGGGFSLTDETSGDVLTYTPDSK